MIMWSLEIPSVVVDACNYTEIIPGKKGEGKILVSNLWSTVICFHFPAWHVFCLLVRLLLFGLYGRIVRKNRDTASL